MDAETIHSVLQIIAAVFAVGALVLFSWWVSLLQRERARESVAELSRVVSRDLNGTEISEKCAGRFILEEHQFSTAFYALMSSDWGSSAALTLNFGELSPADALGAIRFWACIPITFLCRSMPEMNMG